MNFKAGIYIQIKPTELKKLSFLFHFLNRTELNKNSLITRISECISKGEAIDFVFEDEELPEYILDSYKNYIAMRVDFRIFANALNSIGGKDEELLRRYIMGEIDLQGIAAERTIAYETAKGKIRDLKKLLKERTLSFLEEEKVA